MKVAGRAGLYSLVAWPPHELARWVAEVQRDLGLAAFGAPHLNLRAPFEYAGDEGVLLDASARVALDLPAFEVRFRAWRRFPHTVFLELAAVEALREAHARSLRELPVAPSERDGDGYLPHLTLALGVCPWAEGDVWARVKELVPPVLSWTVDAFALTLEQRGEIVELARFGLAQPAVATQEESASR